MRFSTCSFFIIRTYLITDQGSTIFYFGYEFVELFEFSNLPGVSYPGESFFLNLKFE